MTAEGLANFFCTATGCLPVHCLPFFKRKCNRARSKNVRSAKACITLSGYVKGSALRAQGLNACTAVPVWMA